MMLAISIGKFLLVNCASYIATPVECFSQLLQVLVLEMPIFLYLLIISFGFFMQFALNNLQQVFKNDIFKLKSRMDECVQVNYFTNVHG